MNWYKKAKGNMRKYPKDMSDLSKVKWAKYKIIVPTEQDKKELQGAFQHFHNSNINTEYIAVNQLAHEYIKPGNIIIDKKLFNSINK